MRLLPKFGFLRSTSVLPSIKQVTIVGENEMRMTYVELRGNRCESAKGRSNIREQSKRITNNSEEYSRC